MRKGITPTSSSVVPKNNPFSFAVFMKRTGGAPSVRQKKPVSTCITTESSVKSLRASQFSMKQLRDRHGALSPKIGSRSSAMRQTAASTVMRGQTDMRYTTNLTSNSSFSLPKKAISSDPSEAVIVLNAAQIAEYSVEEDSKGESVMLPPAPLPPITNCKLRGSSLTVMDSTF